MKDKEQKKEPSADRVVQMNIVPEMRESYLDYAMSVIVSRALPDVRDGLKPVHRRILYAMHELGLSHQAKFRKSAAVVGDVLGKYHPHGDTSVYDAMVKMAQDFYMRYPLVEGQGNFGSVDGDSAAAMRYCVTGEALVVTGGGLVPIERIASNGREEDDIDIKVLSRDRSVNSASKWFDSGEHPTIKITSEKGYSIRGSRNHPILIWTHDHVLNEPRFEWKLLENVSVGDIAVIDRTNDVLWPKNKLRLKQYVPQAVGRQEVKILPKVLDEDLAHILGALISEGTINEKKIEFCNSDEKWINEFASRWARVFPDCRLHIFARDPNSYGKKPYMRIEIHSTYVVAFLKNIGLLPVRSAHKRVPDAILRSSKPVVSEFLRAYFEGDGSISYSSKMTELSAISKSELLLSELQVILLRFGIPSAKRFDSHRGVYELYIRGLENYLMYEKEIGFVSLRKSRKLRDACARLSKQSSATDYIPFLSEYIRNKNFNFSSIGVRQDYATHYNFDRYGNLERRNAILASAVGIWERPVLVALFEQLLGTKYIFDPVSKIEDGGINKVYSIRVDSPCHSFVSNGYISHNTEARMSRLSTELLRDIEKETVDFTQNYDATRMEPKVLPSAIPNLLLNGTVGIAVGMASKIPPHNLGELMNAVVHLIEHPEATTEDLLRFVSGPDFPTGGIVYNKTDIHHAYASGRGGVVVRGEAEIVETKASNYQIIITSLPYQVNKAEMISGIADQVREKKLEGVRDIRDESTRETRVVIDLKQGINPQKVLNYLYKHSPLEQTFNYNMVTLVDGVPRTLSLHGILEEFLKYRREVVTRRTQFDLKKAEEREHILAGLKKALDHIDEVIKTIKASKDTPTAHANLMKKFSLSDKQSTAILEMRLQKLAGLERKKIEDELEEMRKLIIHLKDLLAHPEKILALIKTECGEIVNRYGDARKTRVMKSGVKEITEEDLVPEAENVLVLTSGGYVKRTDPSEFRAQRRGGVGVIDLDIKEEDFITIFLTANTHDDLLFFTDAGRAYQIKMYELPEGRRATRGKSIVNYLSIGDDERVTSVLPMPKETKQKDLSLVMVTRGGVIKKVAAESFRDVRRNGLAAIRLDDGDQLLGAFFAEKGDTVILASVGGQSIRFKESDVREMGRAAGGVRAILLKKGDAVIGADIVTPAAEKATFMSMSEHGYGKRTPLSEYKVQKRGGSGIKTSNVTAKTGKIMVARVAGDDIREIIAISKNGQVIRTGIDEVPTLGRSTQGVRIMKLREKDAIASLTLL